MLSSDSSCAVGSGDDASSPSSERLARSAQFLSRTADYVLREVVEGITGKDVSRHVIPNLILMTRGRRISDGSVVDLEFEYALETAKRWYADRVADSDDGSFTAFGSIVLLHDSSAHIVAYMCQRTSDGHVNVTVMDSATSTGTFRDTDGSAELFRKLVGDSCPSCVVSESNLPITIQTSDGFCQTYTIIFILIGLDQYWTTGRVTRESMIENVVHISRDPVRRWTLLNQVWAQVLRDDHLERYETIVASKLAQFLGWVKDRDEALKDIQAQITKRLQFVTKIRKGSEVREAKVKEVRRIMEASRLDTDVDRIVAHLRRFVLGQDSSDTDVLKSLAYYGVWGKDVETIIKTTIEPLMKGLVTRRPEFDAALNKVLDDSSVSAGGRSVAVDSRTFLPVVELRNFRDGPLDTVIVPRSSRRFYEDSVDSTAGTTVVVYEDEMWGSSTNSEDLLMLRLAVIVYASLLLDVEFASAENLARRIEVALQSTPRSQAGLVDVMLHWTTEHIHEWMSKIQFNGWFSGLTEPFSESLHVPEYVRNRVILLDLTQIRRYHDFELTFVDLRQTSTSLICVIYGDDPKYKLMHVVRPHPSFKPLEFEEAGSVIRQCEKALEDRGLDWLIDTFAIIQVEPRSDGSGSSAFDSLDPVHDQVMYAMQLMNLVNAVSVDDFEQRLANLTEKLQAMSDYVYDRNNQLLNEYFWYLSFG